ncbi:unnamed protein product [Dimorphilus gyrociliatus]|uniref:Uncharacterized protein n=1 Tax=Dimorphilus gyrociliatus TaxID=2664684 RepID=A0A7I8W0Q0_9ANNE|nr:unnamed protein product [Dimorphilus gyrociliatus]
MSRYRTRYGRYTRIKHNEIVKLNIVGNSNKLNDRGCLYSPFLKADDILSICMNAFSPLLVLSSVTSFSIQIDASAAEMPQDNFVSLEEFVNVWEVTGVELDCRAQIFKASENYFFHYIQLFANCLNNLPGIDKLSEREKITRFVPGVTLIYLFLHLNILKDWFDKKYNVHLCDTNITVNTELIESVSTVITFEKLKQFAKDFEEINFTREEIVLICSLNFFKSRKSPILAYYYKKILVELSNYLENKYNKSSILRWQQLLSFFVRSAEFQRAIVKEYQKYGEYLSKTVKNPVFKSMYRLGDYEENIASIEKLKLF